jgi:hypothetical protein
MLNIDLLSVQVTTENIILKQNASHEKLDSSTSHNRNITLQYKKLISLTLVLSLLGGCASSERLTKADYNSRKKMSRSELWRSEPGCKVELTLSNDSLVFGTLLKVGNFDSATYAKRFAARQHDLSSDRIPLYLPDLGDSITLRIYPEQLVSGVFLGFDYDLKKSYEVVVLRETGSSDSLGVDLTEMAWISSPHGKIVHSDMLNLISEHKLPLNKMLQIETDSSVVTVAFDDIRSATMFEGVGQLSSAELIVAGSVVLLMVPVVVILSLMLAISSSHGFLN